jgi:transposase
MDTSQQAAVVLKDRDSLVALKRQRRSIAEKRRIVEETLVEGASVARVARAHGINANQVFYWRKLYQTGRLGTTSSARLLPVRLSNSIVTLPIYDDTVGPFTVDQPSVTIVGFLQVFISGIDTTTGNIT